MIDFDLHRELNVPFAIISRGVSKAYDEWCQKQVCQECGKRYSDRGPGEIWITETLCGGH